jgi:hypothetical protein
MRRAGLIRINPKFSTTQLQLTTLVLTGYILCILLTYILAPTSGILILMPCSVG